MEYYTPTPITVPSLLAGGQYITLAPTINAFKGYDWVSVQVWWDSFNAFDGNVTFCERKNSRVPYWANVPLQTIGIASASGSHIFQDVDFFAQECALNVNKGSSTTGNIYYMVTARKQYGMEDVVTQLKRIADAGSNKYIQGSNISTLR